MFKICYRFESNRQLNQSSRSSSLERGETMLRHKYTYEQPSAIALINDALACGENINEINFANRRPIDEAAFAGNLSAIKYLIQRGADVRCHPNAEATTNLLYWMASCTDVEKRKLMLQWLLESGTYLQLECNVTEDHVRAALGQIDYVSHVKAIKANPSIDIADKTGLTKVHYSIISGMEIAKINPLIDLNYTGPAKFPMACLLALQGKFDLLKTAYSYNKNDPASLHLNDTINVDLIASSGKFLYRDPRLSFYLANMKQWDLISDYCKACKSNAEIDIKFDYKNNEQVTLPMLVMISEQYDLFKKFTKSMHKDEIDYTSKNESAKSLNDYIRAYQNKHKYKVELKKNPQAYIDSLGEEVKNIEPLQLELKEYLTKEQWDKADDAILRGANPNRVMESFGITPLFYVIANGNIAALNYLTNKNINLFNEANIERTNPLYCASLLHDNETRKKILQWMLQEPQFLKLGCGITREHILAAMGKYFPLPGEGTPDALGLYPYDYLVLSGLRFIKNNSDKNKHVRKNIIKQLTANKLAISSWLADFSHIGLLAAVSDFESIEKALELGIKVDLNERVPFIITDACTVPLVVWMLHKKQHGVLQKWLKEHKSLSFNLLAQVDDPAVTGHSKPNSIFQYLVENDHTEILIQAIKKTTQSLTDLLFVELYVNGEDIAGNKRISILSYLVYTEEWEIVELLITRSLKENLENNNNIAQNYSITMFAAPELRDRNGIKVSLTCALIENRQFDLLERLWRIDPRFIQLNDHIENSSYTGWGTYISNVSRLATDEKGCLLLVKILNENPTLLDSIDLTQQNKLGTSLAWLLASHKQYTLLEKIVDLQLAKISKDSELIGLDNLQDIKKVKLRQLLENKKNIIKKIHEYNQKVIELRKSATIASNENPESSSPKVTISVEERLKMKKEQELSSIVDELQNEFKTLFGDRITVSDFTRKGATASIVFEGSKQDLDAFYKVISQYIFKPASGKDKKQKGKPLNKPLESKGKTTFSIDDTALATFRQNFILDEAVKRQLKKLELDKKAKPDNNYLPSGKIRREIKEQKDIDNWVQFIETAFCRHIKEVQALWVAKSKCLVIQLTSITVWEMWDYKPSKAKPSKKNTQAYQLPDNFIENVILSLIQRSIKDHATVTFNSTNKQIQIVPYDYAPATSNLHDLIYRAIKDNCSPPPKPDNNTQPETAAAQSPQGERDFEAAAQTFHNEQDNDNDFSIQDEFVIQSESTASMIFVEETPPPPVINFDEVNALPSVLEKMKWLFAKISDAKQTYNFLSNVDAEMLTKKNWRAKSNQLIIGFSPAAVKSIVVNETLQSTTLHFIKIQEAINLIFPGFMKIKAGEPYIIIFNTNKYSFETVLRQLNTITACYQCLCLIDENEPSQTDDINNNNNETNITVNKPIESNESEAKPNEAKPAKISEREIYGTLTRFSTDKNLVHHLDVLLRATQDYKDTSKDKNESYYSYLVHLQTVMVLLHQHESRVSNKIFFSLRTIIRHAYLDQNFEGSALIRLMHPLLLAIKEVHNFMKFPATKLRLFSQRLRSDLNKIIEVIENYEIPLKTKEWGSHEEKENEIPKLKAKIVEVYQSTTIEKTMKKKIICMLCSLIGESEEVYPYRSIYANLGHSENLVDKNFDRHIRDLYFKYNLNHLINTVIIPSVTAAQPTATTPATEPTLKVKK